MQNEQAARVLEYWFGEQCDGFPVQDRTELWWEARPEHDREISELFGGILEEARLGGHEDWCATPHGSLALVLVLDQFPRCIYRERAEAFVCDSLSLAVAKRGVAEGTDRHLTWCERSFFYLPFEHSEELADQKECVRLFDAMLAEAPGPAKERLRFSLDFARQHYEIIGKFGRFPHRNRLLGRSTTEAEQKFLDASGGGFWEPRSQKK